MACGSTGWHQPGRLGSPGASHTRDTQQKTALLLLPVVWGSSGVTSGQSPEILGHSIFSPLLQACAHLVTRDTEPTSAVNSVQQPDLSLQHSGNAVL